METLINNPQVCEFKGDPGGRAKKRKHWQVFQPEKNHHGSSESHKKQVAPNALQGLAIEVSLSFTTLHGYLCRAKKNEEQTIRQPTFAKIVSETILKEIGNYGSREQYGIARSTNHQTTHFDNCLRMNHRATFRCKENLFFSYNRRMLNAHSTLSK